MTNAEKYKTAEERAIEFNSFCHGYKHCDGCPLLKVCDDFSLPVGVAPFAWLDLEAESEVAE